MAAGSGTRWAQLGLRIWQFIFSVLVMALIGNMMAQAFSGNPATVNYAMFASAFSLFSLFYLFPASINVDWSGHPIILVVVDTLNAIWFLTSGIALPARLHARDCSNPSYTMFNEITNGANDMEKRCREAQAATAFLWFAWAGYTASMIVDLIQVRQHTSSFQGRRTGRQRPSPMMTQV